MKPEKIHRTIHGKYVSLLPGDMPNEDGGCAGCAFYHEVQKYNTYDSGCDEAIDNHTVSFKNGNTEAMCSHYKGIWREEKVKVDRLPRRKLT